MAFLYTGLALWTSVAKKQRFGVGIRRRVDLKSIRPRAY